MDINLHPSTNIQPATGKILISEPFLADPYFKRTVVILCEHNEQGSFGFVLNKYVAVTIQELLESFPSFPTKIGIGGPVQGSNLYYIHTHGDKISNSIKIKDDLYMGGEFDDMIALVKSGELVEKDIRFFIGYSGWEEGQLAEELEEKSWFVSDLDVATIMDTSDNDLWTNVLSNMGQEYELLTHFPEDPSLN